MRHPTFLLALLALVVAAPSQGTAIELDAVLAYLDLGADTEPKLRAGEIVATRIPEGAEETELAITVAAFFPESLDEAYASIGRGDSLKVDRNVLEFGELGAWPPKPAEFADLRFDAGEASDVTALLRFKGGSEFNLSSDEIARFQALSKRFRNGEDPAAREAVSAAYRELLVERYRAYRERGLAGIAPYDRGRGRSVDPAKTLRLAASAAKFFRKNEPGFYAAFSEFPKSTSEDVENRFYWIKQRVQDRPTFVLSHRMLVKRPGVAILAERQYFIGHSYNSVQIVTAALPVEGGIVPFYVNRTSIDQLAGLTGRVARPIAAGRLIDRVKERFETLRKGM